MKPPVLHPSQRFVAPSSIQYGTPLKTLMDRKLVALIGESLARVVLGFSVREFQTRALRGLGKLELKERALSIAHAMAEQMPADFDELASLLTRSLGPPLAATEGNGLAPFFYFPHTHMIAIYKACSGSPRRPPRRPPRPRSSSARLAAGPTPPVPTTDRYAVYDHLPGDRRQACWAHLRRDFQATIDRANGGSEIGADLLAHADILLDQWERLRDGTLARRGSGRPTWGGSGPRSATCWRVGPRPKPAATCREVLAVEASLWTFARVAGVEPTNNAAERAVRHAVCWRKTSYGTDSEAGSRFVERVLAVVASCRQQGRNVLGFLVEAVQAARTGATPPSLIPAGV